MIDNVKEKETIQVNQTRMYMTIKSFVLNIHVWYLFVICFFMVSLQFDKEINFWTLLCSLKSSVKSVVILTFASYLIHYISHNFRNIFTIIHHYHHETEYKIQGDILQINLEFLASIVCILLTDISPFLVLQFFLIYTTIHNINYGYFQVNQIHKKHHSDILTNIGPDICDVLFGTKFHFPKDHKFTNFSYSIPEEIWNIMSMFIPSKRINKSLLSMDIEDISHIIPNILVSTFVVLILSKIWLTSKTKWLKYALVGTSIISFVVYIYYSIHIFLQDNHPDKTLFL